MTTNYEKHTSENPLQRFFIENFYKSLISIIKELHHSHSEFISESKSKQTKIKMLNQVQHDKNVNSILDVGCGEGFTLKKLEENKIGKTLEGVDFSKEAVQLGHELHPQFKLKQANIYQLPYKENSFDLVLSTEVLEHLENPRKALREIIRVSKKYVLLSVPNEPWFRIQRVLRGKNIFQFGNHPEHIQHWSSEQFIDFVKKEKIKILKVKIPLFWTIVLIEKN